jgi:hypothetical protein
MLNEMCRYKQWVRWERKYVPLDLISGIRLEELRNTMENVSRDRNSQNDCLTILFSGIPAETAATHRNPQFEELRTMEQT